MHEFKPYTLLHAFVLITLNHLVSRVNIKKQPVYNKLVYMCQMAKKVDLHCYENLVIIHSIAPICISFSHRSFNTKSPSTSIWLPTHTGGLTHSTLHTTRSQVPTLTHKYMCTVLQSHTPRHLYICYAHISYIYRFPSPHSTHSPCPPLTHRCPSPNSQMPLPLYSCTLGERV